VKGFLRGTGSVLIGFLLGACNNDEAALWKQGRSYSLTLTVQERPALTSSVIEYHQLIRDTLVLTLTVDSIRDATVYGNYSGSFRGFAIRVGSPSGLDRDFQAQTRGDTVRMELSPSVTDSGLLLSGIVRAETVSGRWSTEAPPRTRGIFTLSW